MCRSLDFGQDQKCVKIEQPSSSFLTAMEDYIKDSPQTLMLSWPPNDDRCITVIPDPEKATLEEVSRSSDDREETSKPEKITKVDSPLIPDLLSWDEPSEEASESIAAQGADDSSETTIDAQSQGSSEATRWEVAPPTTQSCNAAPTTLCKEGVVNRSVLDSLHETAAAKPNVPVSNPFEADDDHSMVYQQHFPVEAGIQQQQQGLEESSPHLDISWHAEGLQESSPQLPVVAQNKFYSVGLR